MGRLRVKGRSHSQSPNRQRKSHDDSRTHRTDTLANHLFRLTKRPLNFRLCDKRRLAILLDGQIMTALGARKKARGRQGDGPDGVFQRSDIVRWVSKKDSDGVGTG